MSTISQFNLGSVCDFTTYSPGLLGSFTNVRVDALVDHQIAKNYIDPAAIHAAIYGSIDEVGVPNDYRRYSYIVVTLANGSRTALGLPWIRSDSIVVKERLKAYVTLDDVSVDDASKISLALKSNGFTVSEVKIE